jgi:hypothetical protein
LEQYVLVDVSEDRAHYYVCQQNLPRIQIPLATNRSVFMNIFYSYLTTSRDWTDTFFRQYRSYSFLSSRLRDNDRVVICSDGAVQQSTAGFGVLFSLNDSVLVVSTMMQITPGWFTQHKYGTNAKLSLTVISDNETLVKTISQ